MLALALWTLSDGVRALTTGRYFGRLIAPDDVARFPHALMLGDGTAIDYGRFGSLLVERGMDPHALAPFFVVTGALGVIGVIAFLLRRPVGYAFVLTSALGAMVRLGLPALAALAIVVVLLLPRVRRAFFRACADREALVSSSS